MKNEQLAAQAQLAADILRDGLSWEYWNAKPEFGPPVIEWTAAGLNGNPIVAISAGSEIRVKPEAPKVDEYAELKAAHKTGKIIQCKQDRSGNWVDIHSPTWDVELWRYRIKPEPVMVPLVAWDVPPGSVFRFKAKADWVTPLCVGDGAVGFPDPNDGRVLKMSFSDLMETAEINRSIPLMGKWDADAWEKCEKEAV